MSGGLEFIEKRYESMFIEVSLGKRLIHMVRARIPPRPSTIASAKYAPSLVRTAFQQVLDYRLRLFPSTPQEYAIGKGVAVASAIRQVVRRLPSLRSDGSSHTIPEASVSAQR